MLCSAFRANATVLVTYKIQKQFALQRLLISPDNVSLQTVQKNGTTQIILQSV